MRTLIAGLYLLVWSFILLMFISWAGNIYKLTQCDFEAPYKGEFIHAAGLLPGVSLITFWNNDK